MPVFGRSGVDSNTARMLREHLAAAGGAGSRVDFLGQVIDFLGQVRGVIRNRRSGRQATVAWAVFAVVLSAN